MADFFGLMKQATELESKMEAMQAELERIEVEGTAGGGLVTLKLSGKGELRTAHVDDFAPQAGSEGNHRGPHRRRACRCPPQARSGVGRADAVADRRSTAPARPQIVLIDARDRRRSRDRTSDPALGPHAGPWAAFGAPRRTVSHQEARSGDGPAGGQPADRDGEDRGVQDLRQHRHAEPLHRLHRPAARSGHYCGGGRCRRLMGA